MSRLFRTTKNKLLERGQVLVVVTVAAVAIIAIIGLSLDVGIMFIDNARLRRAVDAAALGAALQVREGYKPEDLDKAATEFLLLNGITLDPDHPVHVDSCDSVPSLCDEMVNGTPTPVKRKLVRVSATGDVHLAFLPVIGINTVAIAANAISETASVDVVLVIDRSQSMTFSADASQSQMLDPSKCNQGTTGDGYVGQCKPFDTVKRAAVGFVDRLFYPYDRVAVVTFDKDYAAPLDLDNDCQPTPPATSCTEAEIMTNIETVIKNLTVYQGADDFSSGQIPARCYDGDQYQKDKPTCEQVPNFERNEDGTFITDPDGNKIWNFQGFHSAAEILYHGDPNFDPRGVPTTNIGGGLAMAGDEFAHGVVRQQALWVVILLTDGVANNGYLVDAHTHTIDHYYCPKATFFNIPYCNDGYPWTRHKSTDVDIFGKSLYDAEDYAYDEADFVGQKETATTHGQGALVFAIGLGDEVMNYGVQKTPSSPVVYPGDEFLKYAANVGRGEYFYAPSDAQLQEIFRKIADNIAIRLTH